MSRCRIPASCAAARPSATPTHVSTILPVAPVEPAPVAQRAAVHQLGDEVLTSLELVGVVHGEDVRMVQRRCELRFALEAAARRRVGDVSGQKLDRDRAIQLRVGRAIDGAHAAFAEQLLEPIHADRRSRCERFTMDMRCREGYCTRNILGRRLQRRVSVRIASHVRRRRTSPHDVRNGARNLRPGGSPHAPRTAVLPATVPLSGS